MVPLDSKFLHANLHVYMIYYQYPIIVSNSMHFLLSAALLRLIMHLCTFIFSFHHFFVLCYTYRLIKLISPNLNYFIIAGASMVFLSIFVRIFPIDTSNEEKFKQTRLVFCYVRPYHNKL